MCSNNAKCIFISVERMIVILCIGEPKDNIKPQAGDSNGRIRQRAKANVNGKRNRKTVKL